MNPFNLQWMQHHDWANHLLGWLFYRNAEWSWPLGYFDTLIHPVGTSTALTDSIPILAFLFKLFSPLLPDAIQYHGLWLLSCFFGQAFVGSKIFKVLKWTRTESSLGLCFLTLAPVLLYRIVHASLCAQWILLIPIYWALQYYKTGQEFSKKKAVLLVLFTAGVHPYIWAMLMVLLFGLRLQECIKSFRKELGFNFLYFSSLVMLTLGSWYVWGYFLFESPVAGGFDYYRSDLTVFFNPMGEKALLPRISAGPGQYEGYAYLGLSIIAGLPLALYYAIKLRSQLKVLGFFIFATLSLWIFALSSNPSFAGKALINLDTIYSFLGPLPQTFRSSGRFAWPLYYFIFILSLHAIKKISKPYATWTLAALLCLQAYDIKRYFFNEPAMYPLLLPPAVVTLDSEISNAKAQNIVMIPQGENSAECSGRVQIDPVEYRRFEFYAASRKLKINAGATSRVPLNRLNLECQKQKQLFSDNSKTAYAFIIHSSETQFLKDSKRFCQDLDMNWTLCI